MVLKKNQRVYFALFIALAKNEYVTRMFWKGGIGELKTSKGCFVFFATISHEQMGRGTLSLGGGRGTLPFLGMGTGAWRSTLPCPRDRGLCLDSVDTLLWPV